jgi:hypothetical protein
MFERISPLKLISNRVLCHESYLSDPLGLVLNRALVAALTDVNCWRN